MSAFNTPVRLISHSTWASSSRAHLPPLSRRLPVLPSRSALLSPRTPATRTAAALLSRRNASTASSSASPPTPHVPPPPSSTTALDPDSELDIMPPSLAAIQAEGYLDDDVALLPAPKARIRVSPDALRQLVRITEREPAEVLGAGKLALRVGVESGGCHGYQYTMALTEERGADDYVMQPRHVKSIPIVIDLVSLGLLKGATLHYATELIGASFRIQDNPQAKQGGSCGCGVSWEAVPDAV